MWTELTWRKHISTRRKQPDPRLRKSYCIIGRKSQSTRENQLLVCKAILKPIWTCGLQLWVKVKWSRHKCGVAQRVGRGITLLFHDRGTRILKPIWTCGLQLWVKVKWSRHKCGVAQRVGRGIALLFHDRGARIQLWVSASNCNIQILETFQSKVLRIITEAPWYVANAVIIRDLQVLSVRQ